MLKQNLEDLMRRGYYKHQIALHWMIALLLPIQFLTGGSIERTHHAVHMGTQPSPFDLLQHKVHIYAGIAVGLLMGLRLILRVFQPPSSNSLSRGSQIAASVMHFGLYGAVLLQAALGFVASYLTFSVAPLHIIGSYVILAMVALHFGAAVWHTLIAKDDTVDRMILPRSDQPTTWTVSKAKTT